MSFSITLSRVFKTVLFFAVLPSPAVAQYDFVAIGTGGSTGVYFQAGNAICRMLHKEAAEGRDHNIRCIPVTTGGSVDNILKVVSGKMDFGVVQSDVQHHSYTGSAYFAGAEYKNLRAVLSLHSEPFHLLVRPGSGISSWDDLKGKRVNVGSRRSGVRSTFDQLMMAYNVDTAYFGRATELTSAEQMQALCKGRIDAYGNTVGVPSASVARAIRDCGASIISLDSPVVRKFVSDRPYYGYLTIPGSAYEGMVVNVRTLGVIATLVTTAKVDEALVYEVVRAVFENIDHIREIHSAFTDLDPQQMACQGHVAPFHDGARKYFVEHGLDECP